MAPPSFVLPPTQHGLMFPKLFPSLPPPPPPPPPYLYRNLRNAGFGWPLIPRIPRAQHSCRPKKIIKIIDPQTGQDVTEELLSSVSIEKKTPPKRVAPPIRSHNSRRIAPLSSPLPIPLGLIRKAPPPPQFILKCNPGFDPFWPENEQQWSRNFMGSSSWPPKPFLSHNDSVGSNGSGRKRYQSVNNSQKNIVKYSRDVLISLRNHPLAMKKPEGLPDLEVIKHDGSFDDNKDKWCDNGTQTETFKSGTASKTNGNNAFNAKSKPRTRNTNRPRQISISKESTKKTKPTQEEKLESSLDRGDSKEMSELDQELSDMSLSNSCT